MSMIAVHILQSFPPSILNRDDNNTPKWGMFGGSKRARISSQCYKRKIREDAREDSKYFSGIRTSLIKSCIVDELKNHNLTEKKIEKISNDITSLFVKKNDGNMSLYFSQDAVKEYVNIYLEHGKTQLNKQIGTVLVKDDADIKFFGRMSANCSEINIEGCSYFNHAISTHVVDDQIDFFTTVNEKLGKGQVGADYIDHQLFNSACYYRVVMIDLDLFWNNFSNYSDVEKDEIMKTFILSVLKAIPSAKQHSYLAKEFPSYVLGVKVDKRNACTLSNAFEEGVKATSTNGLIDKSIEKMKDYWEKQKNIWGIKPHAEVAIPDVNVEKFVKDLLK